MSGNPVVSGCDGVHDGWGKHIILCMFQCPTPIIQSPAIHDNEWLKNVAALVIGLLVGVFSALFIEPLKVSRQKKIDAMFGEAQLYDELGQTLAGFRVTLAMPDKFSIPLVQRVKFDKYDFYYGQRRELFYAMRDNVGIYQLHAQYALILRPESIAKYGAKHCVEELVSACEWSMKSGWLSKKRLETIVAKYNAQSDAEMEDLYQHIMTRGKA